MNIALITYDEPLKNEILNKLAGNNIKTYVDSISMLKELDEFNPSIIIYDASAGNFAFDDLKFLISREKVKGKPFKVLYSKLNPIDRKSLSGENIEFYAKEDEIDRLISETKKQIEEMETVEEIPEFEESTPEFSPEDIESFYQSDETSENIPEFESMFSNAAEEEINDFQEIPQSLEEIQFEPEAKEEHKILKENETKQSISDFTIPEPIEKPVLSTSNINISLDIDDIKKGIVMVAVDKLVENIKNEPQIKNLTDDIARDFVSRIEDELENLKEELKNEVRDKILPKIEEEITAILKQDLKDYIAEITSKIVKEKLDQIFKK